MTDHFEGGSFLPGSTYEEIDAPQSMSLTGQTRTPSRRYGRIIGMPGVSLRCSEHPPAPSGRVTFCVFTLNENLEEPKFPQLDNLRFFGGFGRELGAIR